MKRKKLLIVGAALSLVLAGCGNANNYLAPQEFQLQTGYTEAAMAGVTNGSACTVNGIAGIKVGTSKKGGSLSITIPANTTDLTFYCAAWKGGNNTSVTVTTSPAITFSSPITLAADDGISNNSPFTLSGDDADFKFDYSLSNVSAQTVITLSANSRFVAWDAQYKVASIPVDNSCTVTFNAMGGEDSSVEIEKGSTVTELPSPTKANDTTNQIRYEFVGWYTNVDVTNPNNPDFTNAVQFTTSTEVNTDVTVYARYTAIPYHVIHFVMNGAEDKEDLIVDDGTVPGDIPAERYGHNFDGWFTDADLAAGHEFDGNVTLTQNKTIYAKWTRQEFQFVDDYRLTMVPANGGSYTIEGEITAIVDTNKFFVQDGENVMYINDSKFNTQGLQEGNTVRIAGHYNYSNAIVEFDQVAYLDVLSNDTVNSQTPLTYFEQSTYSNNLKYFEYDGLKLTSGFTSVSSNNDDIKASFENTYGNILYVNNINYVNDGTFNPEDYASGDYVLVKGALYRYFNKSSKQNTMEYFITSIEKRTPVEISLIYDSNNPTDVTSTVAMEGGKLRRPNDPNPIKDENYLYTLENWYLDPNDTEPYDFNTPVTGPITLYAKWTQTPRAAKTVVREDLYSRGFLSYKYEKQTVDSSISHTLNNANTINASTQNYSDWTYSDTAAGIGYAGQSAGSNGCVQLRTKNNNSGIVVTTNNNNTAVSKITVVWDYGNGNTNTTGRHLDVYGKDTAYEAATDLYNTDKQGTLLTSTETPELVYTDDEHLTTVFEPTDDFAFIGIRSADSAVYLSSITIEWGDGAVTQYTYSDVYLRFSGFISVSLWDRLEAESDIQGYGILLCETEWLGSGWLQEKEVDGVNVKRFYTPLTATYTHPTLANDRQKGERVGDYYIWNLKKSISTENLTTAYTAMAFIVVDGETVYLNETSYSAQSLALEYINTGFYAEDYDEGALYNLAHMTKENA